MKAMIKIDSDLAMMIWKYSSMELYELHENDGSESLVYGVDVDELNPLLQYGIEGDLFGEPYESIEI